MTIVEATTTVKKELQPVVAHDAVISVTAKATKKGSIYYIVNLPKNMEPINRLRAIQIIKSLGMDWR